MNWQKAWRIVALIGLGTSLGLALNTCIIFYLAYFNPGRGVLVYVNNFSEGHVEAVVFPLMLVLGIIAWWQVMTKRRL